MFHRCCPRCGQGDLLCDYEDQLICLQCGYELRPDEKVMLLARLAQAYRNFLQEARHEPQSQFKSQLL